MAVKDWSSSTWITDHTEIYSYEPDLDYLTGVDYNDGLANEVVTWDYDAAGNRKSDSRYSSGGTWTYDWLNRMTHSPSLDGTGPSTWNYTNDILGNRTNRNLQSSNAAAAIFTWDPLNRMTNLYRPSVGASYYYRADGMRVEKVDGATLSWVPPDPADSRASGHYDTNYGSNRATTRYFYDGQMPMEEDYNPSGTVTKVTRNTLGGRGIDMISTTASSTTTLAYPLYDGHGNMVATLGKNGSGGYTTASWRTYDVWGSVRSGSATGDPTKRYSANLGHQADDESDLLYMRARNYEPASGRFLSRDPAFDGINHYSYCASNPVSFVDESGKISTSDSVFIFFTLGMINTFAMFLTESLPRQFVAAQLAVASFFIAMEFASSWNGMLSNSWQLVVTPIRMGLLAAVEGTILAQLVALRGLKTLGKYGSVADKMGLLLMAYAFMIIAAVIASNAVDPNFHVDK